MSTRGMYIFEFEKPQAVYVHHDNYIEGAIQKFKNWAEAHNSGCSPALGSDGKLSWQRDPAPVDYQMFIDQNKGTAESSENSHPDIEYRYRVFTPYFENISGRKSNPHPQETDVLNLMVLAQKRQPWQPREDGHHLPFAADNGSSLIWDNLFCGPMFVFINQKEE